MYDPSDLSGEKQSSSHETDSKDLSGQEVSPHSASANQFSLRTLLPSARFLTENDISFHSVSESAQSSQPGQLAIYRIGEDCPSQIIADATARGAAGILTEQILPSPIPQCVVGDLEVALASITAQIKDRPDRKLLNIGVIGSAGKQPRHLSSRHYFDHQELEPPTGMILENAMG